MTHEFKNILIVRTDRIGDVVLTTPSITALREQYPNAKIAVLVSPLTRELVDGNSCLDEVLVDDRTGEHKGFGYFKLIGLLRREHFDVAVIYHTKRRTNLACFLAGIPVRIGYKNDKFGFLLNRPVVDTRQKGEKHEAQYCLDILKKVGIDSSDLKMYLPVNEESILWIERFCDEHEINKNDQLIAIHSGASDPSKRWSEDHFAELIDNLIERYSAKIIMTGSFEEKDGAKRIISAVSGHVIDLTGKTTVGQLAALITRCDLLVSNDSGPVHIAAGVGTPVVSIFTRNQPGINPERWKPLSERSRVISVKPSQNIDVSFKKARPMDVKYMELIAPARVLEAVDSLFKLC
jgi:heptosyltransferase-2